MDCTDEAVFAQAQQGDRGAFGLLVHRYQDRVYSLALRILHHQHDAEDAVQQAFLHAWQKRQMFDPQWRFCTWLYRIVTNTCIDEYRRQQRRKPVSETCLASLPASSAPDREYERSQLRQMLTIALGQVPVEARTVLMLCYMEGLPYAEIARIRGITVHTVKSQLRRAKALLRHHVHIADEEGL